MQTVLINGTTAINVDNKNDTDRLIAEGWRQLSDAEITAAGITGYEQYVGPQNTTIADDGTITFVVPVIDLDDVTDETGSMPN